MKKFLAVVLSLLFVLAMFAGCGPKENGPSVDIDKYPEKVIQFYVNRAAGGATDLAARALATTMESELGWATTVINVDGGDGLMGLNEAMTAEADGYTFLVIGSTEVPNILVNYPGALFTREDLNPVCQITAKSMILIVKKDSPFKTFAEFVEHAKSHPGELTIAVAGSNNIYSPMIIEKAVDIDLTIVNSGSGANAWAAVLGGHVDAAFVGSNYYKNSKAEGLTVLADSANRTEQPEGTVKTFLAQGYNITNENFNYVLCHKDVPQEIVELVSEKIATMMTEGELDTALDTTGQGHSFKGVNDFKDFYNSYIDTMIDIYNEINANK